MIFGSVWGLSEAALGFGLRACAHTLSGSLMTGVALFFLAASWASTRNYLVLLLVVLTAGLFKLFDAVLLSLPLRSGAIGNPIFAFILEGLAFLVMIRLFQAIPWRRRISGAILGACAAILAVMLFPLVKYATGVPACVYPGTSIPLSIYFAPLAMACSAILVPLGLRAGSRVRTGSEGSLILPGLRGSPYLVSPLAMILCLGLVTLFRLFIG